MENIIESLQNIIDTIKRKELWHGRQVAEEEIAQRVNLSKEQLLKYLNGEEKIPEGLETKMSSYGLKRVLVHDVQTRHIHISPEDEEEQ